MSTSHDNRPLGTLRLSPIVCGLIVAWLIPAIARGADHAHAAPRSFPDRNLTAYVEYDGLKAHAGAWKATAAHAMLNDTPAGAMITEIVKQIADRLLKEVPNTRLKGSDFIALHDQLIAEGFAAGIYMEQGEPRALIIVFKGMGTKYSRGRLERLFRTLAGDTPLPAPIRVRGRELYQDNTSAPANNAPKQGAARVDLKLNGEAALTDNENRRLGGADLNRNDAALTDNENRRLAGVEPTKAEKPAAAHNDQPSLSAWFEKEDLIIVAAPSASENGAEVRDKDKPAPLTHAAFVAEVFDTIEGKRPNASQHPGYLSAAAEGADLKGFEADGLFFIEMGTKSEMLAGVAGALGGMNPLAIGGLSPLGNVTIKPSADLLRFFKGPSAISAAAEQLIGVSRTLRGSSFPTSRIVIPGNGAELPPGAVVVPHGNVLPSDPSPRRAPANERSAPSYPAPSPAPSPGPATTPSTVRCKEPDSYSPPLTVDEPQSPVPQLGRSIPTETPAPTPIPTAPQGREKPEEPKGDEKAIDAAEILGLNGITRIVGRWGFQEKSLITDVRIEAPAPRKGFVSWWIDQPAMSVDRLPPIPRGAREFTFGSFDLEPVYSKVVSFTKQLGPEAAAEFGELEAAVQKATGLRLREDFLRHLGPSWAVITPPSRADVPRRSNDFDPRDYVLVAGVKDPAALGAVVDKLAAQANAYLRSIDAGAGDAGARKEADIPVMILEKIPAPDRGYRLTSPAGIIPWLDDEVEPVILIGRSCVVLAANVEQAREVILAEQGAERRWKPDGALANVFQGLPANLTFFSLGDPRKSAWPDALAHMPGTVQYLIGLVELGAGEGEPDASPALALIGIPRRGAFRLRLGPASLPKARDLRAHLFPSILAATVDARGLRIIGREAFPFACLPMDVNVKK